MTTTDTAASRARRIWPPTCSRRVLAAMRHLSEKDRAVLGLRVAAGLPHAQVAEVLGVSEHAATTAANRALARVRRHLEPKR